jgi:hypothetical protein
VVDHEKLQTAVGDYRTDQSEHNMGIWNGWPISVQRISAKRDLLTGVEASEMSRERTYLVTGETFSERPINGNTWYRQKEEAKKAEKERNQETYRQQVEYGAIRKEGRKGRKIDWDDAGEKKKTVEETTDSKPKENKK